MNEHANTVLIVDDHALERKIIRKRLENDYAILEAENGQEAIQVLEQNRDEVCVVLLDLIMPVMDGVGFLEERRRRGYMDTPVIVMTAEEQAETDCLRLGATDFLSKPVNPDILMLRVKNVVNVGQIKLLEELRYLKDHDHRTRLYNAGRLNQEIRKRMRDFPSNRYVCVRMEIERYKVLSSFWGEEEISAFLLFVAEKIEESTTLLKKPIYGRVHADVFWILAEGGLADVVGFVTTLQKGVNEFDPENPIELAFGVYEVTDTNMTPDAMFSRAGIALRKQLRHPGNNVGFYDENMEKELLREREIVSEMQAALDNGEFIPYFQPKYKLENGMPYGSEALVRWNHPEKGLIAPSDFIPLFERNGFIHKLDLYMWEKVCSLLREWIDAGLDPAPVSVNISRVSMDNPEIVDVLIGLVKKYDISPALLNLELTESAYMDRPDMMLDIIKRLQKAGFVLMMDDFGSGYSSLNTLKDIPVDVLKIDIEFLSSNLQGSKGERILASVIRMAAWLDLPVIVEGVENEAQKKFLESVGCNFVQGYYYSRPMPLTQYESLLRTVKQTSA